MKKLIYLDHQEKSITGGHIYNDAFVNYFKEITRVTVQSTPSCAHKYRSWRKIFSPIIELKHLRLFRNGTLVMFGDTSYKHHLLLAALTKLFTRAKTTMIVHHFLFVGQNGFRWSVNKWLICKYTSLMDSIIVPSPFTLDMAMKLFPRKTVYYVPLPFEQKFMCSDSYEIGNLLYVGTVEQRKGLSYLIDAISLLDNKSNVKLNIVGKVVDQLYYEKLKQQIATLGLSNNVCFYGRVSDEVLAECYQKAEIFTFPSLLEGYGIVLVEAFNNGLPIICFNNTAMPYTVKDGVNGLVAKNEDSKDMAGKIHQLMGNTALRKQLQEGIKDTVMHLKTTRDFERAIESFYEQIS